MSTATPTKARRDTNGSPSRREVFLSSVKRKADRTGAARFEQRFLLQQNPNGSAVTAANSHVQKFVEVATLLFLEEHDNPWWTFGELWTHGRDKFMALYLGQNEEAVRGAMRNVWSKATTDGYGLMEKRSISKRSEQSS